MLSPENVILAHNGTPCFWSSRYCLSWLSPTLIWKGNVNDTKVEYNVNDKTTAKTLMFPRFIMRLATVKMRQTALRIDGIL
jgi:hypothetical protein